MAKGAWGRYSRKLPMGKFCSSFNSDRKRIIFSFFSTMLANASFKSFSSCNTNQLRSVLVGLFLLLDMSDWMESVTVKFS